MAIYTKLLILMLIPLGVAYGVGLFFENPNPMIANIDLVLIGWTIIFFFNYDKLHMLMDRQILLLKIKMCHEFSFEDAYKMIRRHATDVARIDERNGEIRFLIRKKQYTMRLKQD